VLRCAGGVWRQVHGQSSFAPTNLFFQDRPPRQHRHPRVPSDQERPLGLVKYTLDVLMVGCERDKRLRGEIAQPLFVTSPLPGAFSRGEVVREAIRMISTISVPRLIRGVP